MRGSFVAEAVPENSFVVIHMMQRAVVAGVDSFFDAGTFCCRQTQYSCGLQMAMHDVGFEFF